MVISSLAVVVLHVVMNAPAVSLTIISISSVTSTVPSFTVSVRVISVMDSTEGAVMVGVSEVSSENPTAGVAGLCDHEYIRVSSASWSVALPDSASEASSASTRSDPASTSGGLLSGSASASRRTWTPWSNWAATAA